MFSIRKMKKEKREKYQKSEEKLFLVRFGEVI